MLEAVVLIFVGYSLLLFAPPFLRAEVTIDEKERPHLADKRAGLNLTQTENGTFFYFHESETSWQEARDFCLAHGMQLASFKNAHEMEIVAKIAPQNLKHWVSASDVDREAGHFAWADGSPLDFDLWGLGQPDEWGKWEGPACVALDADKLVDRRCTAAGHSVCQLMQNSTETTSIKN